jgi:hypothetical protein
MKLRVFVSSVMESFQAYREAARKGIVAAGGEPVLVEDFPSLSISPRTACLDAVASCDIYSVIVGDRGGWSTPSGKLAVEEEYEEALRCKLRIIAFVEAVRRDKEAERLVSRLSDYIDGLFRTTFSGSDQLQELVEKALTPTVKNNVGLEVDAAMINKILKTFFKIGSEGVLRMVFAPERNGQLIDPVALESADLYSHLMEIGHSSKIALFSYDFGKTKEIGVNEIIITQAHPTRHVELVNVVRLELTSNGILTVDTNITGRVQRGERYDMLNSMVIAEEDILTELTKIFAFTLSLFEKCDPYNRYDKLLYNVTLSNIGHRRLEANPRPKTSYQIPMRPEGIILAFDAPRVITRVDLRAPARELEAIMSFFRRRLRD